MKCRNRCICTDDRKLLPIADAVLFALKSNNVQDFNFADLPKRQNLKQIFALALYETPERYGRKNISKVLNDKRAMNYFNMTVSYRHDADVILKYHELVRHKGSKLDTMVSTKSGRNQVAWIVSDCKAPNKREKIVERLKQYGINVTIFGGCGKSIYHYCPHWRDHCLEDIVKDYKFYIAFENSLCKYYLSEKSSQFMNISTIPIVLSYGDPESKLPPKSYINALDFTSVKDLADYISYLDKNDDKYLEYFEWWANWKVFNQYVSRPKTLCRICDLLYTNYHKMYGKISEWYIDESGCKKDGISGLFSDIDI